VADSDMPNNYVVFVNQRARPVTAVGQQNRPVSVTKLRTEHALALRGIRQLMVASVVPPGRL